MDSVVDVLIAGGGPAGLTAALTLARQLHTVIIFDNKDYRNTNVSYMHMIPTWDYRNPTEFRSKARDEILNYYNTVKIEEVDLKIAEKSSDGLFQLIDTNHKVWKGRKLIITTGSENIIPDIPGYAEAWGQRIYHCLFCKGYEDRYTDSAGVLAIQSAGNISMVIHQTESASQLAKKVTIYTNGAEELGAQIILALTDKDKSCIMVNNTPIKQLTYTRSLIYLELADGTTKEETFLVHNPDTTVKGPLAAQLGLELTPMGDINAAPPLFQTSIRGVFAAGDCVTPYKVIAGAISSGCNAAVAASAQLLAEKHNHQPLF
ncbi:hypothetical protein BDV38DRAFT_297025 [Aspergillus pseudotamarii]|uniref:FAD/NAD(P)-binding domain-containing protein n=1 Tax=Aspergillus pseudotamarii TaxID=132259 RepID=A0A5N6SCK3_ASPPS|nr:uncharacterized protein BDV38DRAFT_297025 [Aspergillus pseudotamarii]KAE8132442.1 hypothetical protein BDV38DRAFT_297025 [Aspergillus pseudotamarii]